MATQNTRVKKQRQKPQAKACAYRSRIETEKQAKARGKKARSFLRFLLALPLFLQKAQQVFLCQACGFQVVFDDLHRNIFARTWDDYGARDTFLRQDDMVTSRTFAGKKFFKQEKFYELARVNAPH